MGAPAAYGQIDLKELEKAVGIYPKYANAWFDLGRARVQQRAERPGLGATRVAVTGIHRTIAETSRAAKPPPSGNIGQCAPATVAFAVDVAT